MTADLTQEPRGERTAAQLYAWFVTEGTHDDPLRLGEQSVARFHALRDAVLAEARPQVQMPDRCKHDVPRTRVCVECEKRIRKVRGCPSMCESPMGSAEGLYVCVKDSGHFAEHSFDHEYVRVRDGVPYIHFPSDESWTTPPPADAPKDGDLVCVGCGYPKRYHNEDGTAHHMGSEEPCHFTLTRPAPVADGGIEEAAKALREEWYRREYLYPAPEWDDVARAEWMAYARAASVVLLASAHQREAELTRERDAEFRQHARLQRLYLSASKRLTAAEAQVAALREALRELRADLLYYGEHTLDCAARPTSETSHLGRKVPCTCGLEELLGGPSI